MRFVWLSAERVVPKWSQASIRGSWKYLLDANSWRGSSLAVLAHVKRSVAVRESRSRPTVSAIWLLRRQPKTGMPPRHEARQNCAGAYSDAIQKVDE